MKLDWDFSEWFEFGDRLATIAKFEEACKEATQQLAKELHEMLKTGTPVKTGKLVAGWDNAQNYSYEIKETKNGYFVELINDVEYALYVNDGHYSYNQYGGPYEVKNRTVPYTQGNSDPTFVFGHFFVEKSIVLLENSTTLNVVIEKELDKWFRWCVDGK